MMNGEVINMLVTGMNISKTNGDKCIVDDVNFSIEDKDKIALIGVNGTGKSTLLKMIAMQDHYQGKMIYKKDIKINYLPQNPTFVQEDTIYQSVLKNIDTKNINEYEIKTVLNKFGIKDEKQQIKYLSGGQIKRVALAMTLIKPCDLLILDEPTNHLDNRMIDYLEKYLMKWNKGLLMVTHDRYFLERVTNRIIEIDRTKLYFYEANYSKYLELKQLREETNLAIQRKRKNFLKKELEWVRAGVQARTTKSKDRLQRFEQLSQIQDIETVAQVSMIQGMSRLGKKTIELNEITKSFGDQLLFEPFSYMFKKHDRIGILGDNGTGKSTLLNIITGHLQPDQGEVIVGETVHFGYFKQGYDDLPLDKKVIDYIRDISDHLNTNEGSLSAKNMCERFLFDARLQHTLISRLSGGERRRLYLLRILMTMPNVLILDEPTNDLDIQTLTILEDYLDDFAGIIITVSHDRYFLDRICDGLFVLKNQQLCYVNGGYSVYIDSETNEEKEKVKKSKDYRAHKQKKLTMTYQEKKELEGMENVISDLENQIILLEDRMNEVQDFQEIAKLTKQRDELIEQLDLKNNRFLELLELEEKVKQQ